MLLEAAISDAQNLNESGVRFHFIDPILRALGYPECDNTYLKLEERLEYPYHHIGRRSKKDMPLGFPDYRAGIDGARGSFIIEAKSGGHVLTSKDAEQAHSYATHPQVGANFFALCNGIEFLIFAALSGPSAQPIVQIPICEVAERFHEIENILSPTALAKHCQIEYDTGLRLGDGLGSTANIRSGAYRLREYEYFIYIDGQDQTALLRNSLPQIQVADQQLAMLRDSFELSVRTGTAARNEQGKIQAEVQFAGATIHNREAMRLLGIDKLTFETLDKFISTSPENPSFFEANYEFLADQGMGIPDLFGNLTQMEQAVRGETFTQAAMYLDGDRLKGSFIAISSQLANSVEQPRVALELVLTGPIELHLDR